MRLGPDLAAMTVDDSLDGGQPDAGPGELLAAVQPLEGLKELVHVCWIESVAIVFYEKHQRLAMSFLRGVRLLPGAEFDFGRGPF